MKLIEIFKTVINEETDGITIFFGWVVHNMVKSKMQ